MIGMDSKQFLDGMPIHFLHLARFGVVVVRRFASPYSSSPSVFLLVGFVSNLDSFSSSATADDEEEEEEEAFVDDVVFIPLAMLTVFLGPMVGLY